MRSLILAYKFLKIFSFKVTTSRTTKPPKRVTTSSAPATLADDYYDEVTEDSGLEEPLPSFGNARIRNNKILLF